MLTHLSLFSGIGGLDLAAEMAGILTVGQCEWADYQTKVLEKHWPNVPRWRDIKTLTKESFYEKTSLRTVDIISGGFPCQPFSVAGKQKGKWDDRYLWPGMLRVIRELTPRWVIGENVPGILRIAASDVISDLEREGYDVAVFDFEAAAVGAPHRRERIAFVGCRKVDDEHSRTKRSTENVENSSCSRRCEQGLLQKQQGGTEFKRNGETLAYTEMRRQQREQPSWSEARRSGRCVRWPAEPDVGRVAYGVPNRVDRLKCLGNAVVPQQFYPIFKEIAEIEKGEKDD